MKAPIDILVDLKCELLDFESHRRIHSGSSAADRLREAQTGALAYLLLREMDRAHQDAKLRDIIDQQRHDLEKAYASLKFGDTEAALAVLVKYSSP